MAKGYANKKPITNVVDLADEFCNLNLKQKMEVAKNTRNTLDTGLTSNGIKMRESERPQIEAMFAWMSMNILIGNELCPASHLLKDINRIVSNQIINN